MSNWALILGASSGIGAACAKELAKNGFNIFGIYLLIKKNKNPNKIILASGKRTFINNIINFFIPDIKNKIDYSKMSHTRSNIGDNSKAIKMLGWKIKKSSLDAAKDILNYNN